MSKVKRSPGRAPVEGVVLNRLGYLRIPMAMLPADARKRTIYLVLAGIDVDTKTIFLRPTHKMDLTDGQWARKAQYPNSDSLSPIVTVNSLLEVLGVPLPDEAVSVKAKKHSDTIEVSF